MFSGEYISRREILMDDIYELSQFVTNNIFMKYRLLIYEGKYLYINLLNIFNNYETKVLLICGRSWERRFIFCIILSEYETN